MPSQQEILYTVETSETLVDSLLTKAIHNTAAAMVEESLDIQENQKVLIWFDPAGMPLVKEMYLCCLAKGADVSFFMRDLDEDARVIPDFDHKQIKAMFTEEKRLIEEAEAILIVRGPENPEALSVVPEELLEAYNQASKKAHHRRMIDKGDGGVDWCLFLWPTEYEAKKEKLPYNEYAQMYFEACDQPWERIKEAQAILKAKLDKGKTLELIANEGDEDERKRTHLTMSIEDMTFGNSTIDRNYPGSEVFSAPVLESVNGQIYAEGEYLCDSHLMKNIYLRIEDGKIIEDRAEEGNDGLQAILKQGEGARYFGEVALGTNPGLTRRFFNDLLNEKVSGSFHMAIGHCYNYTEYAGEPVNVNNGNTKDRTPVHWDLTILMHRNEDGSGGGKVILDGEIIQEDGIFCDHRLAILNPKKT